MRNIFMESVASVGMGFRVHPVARVGGAEMREPGARQENVRAIDVIDRRENASAFERGSEVDVLATTRRFDGLRERRVCRDGGLRERVRRRNAADASGTVVVRGNYHSRTVGIQHLDKTQ